tara:strand:+ start:135 stop:1127 length:993 start_codon:yes stop_codon:yes gene_type:complete
MKFRQLSLAEVLGIREEQPPPGAHGIPEIYDFFAGAGGFSEGARAAGCRVAWVCDNDPVALKTHAANHPATAHCLAELPMPRSAWPFPKDGRAFHAHFSPPCQKFSSVNQSNRVAGDQLVAKNLVEWSIETALTCGAQTWSLEQVPNRAVIKLVEAAKRRNPGRVAYAQVDLSELGVPQTRTRLIAGSPMLVAQLLRRLSRSNRTSVKSAIAKPQGTHVRNGKGWIKKTRGVDGKWQYTKAGWGDNCRSVNLPAPTVLAHRELSWVTRRAHGGGYDHCHLKPVEIASLQTFPLSYKWPDTMKHSMHQIGNAIPPLVAQLLLAPFTTVVAE